MNSPFSFEGQLSRPAYAVWSLGILASQYLFVGLEFWAGGQSLDVDLTFVVAPMRALVCLTGASDFLFLFGLVYLLAAAWLLAALALRRAADAQVSQWVGVYAVPPVTQILVVLFLCLAPSRPPKADREIQDGRQEPNGGWAAAAQGVTAGMVIVVAAVAIGALVFGTYGFGMFVLSPLVVGAMTGYLANRRHDLGGDRTARLVLLAASLGGVGLIAVALEGIVCIVLAAPIGLGAALVGGILGRSIARYTHHGASRTLSGLASLPVAFATEVLLPPSTHFDTMQSVEIDAPPASVWNAIVHMSTIDEELTLPFRLGVTYPIRGEIVGEGVGAERRGEFSTGTAIERVTEWDPEREFSFIVVDDVPSMREMSPYAHVHAPHVSGYFLTTRTSFELSAAPGGRTVLVEHTSHQLNLDPVLYWLPLARRMVDDNNARVLAHIRTQAERASRSTG